MKRAMILLVGTTIAYGSAYAADNGTRHVVAIERVGSISLEHRDRARAPYVKKRIARLSAVVLDVPVAEYDETIRAMHASGLYASVEEDAIASITEIPNDPLFFRQWWIQQISAHDAWDVGATNGMPLVAVIDTGVDATHPDLVGRVISGYDFANDDDDPMDDNRHGTQMAGIIAAYRNNSLGVAGLADAQILAVKVLDETGFGPYSAIADGIVFAADRGARIVNLSLAGPANTEILKSAVDYARARGVVIVAAAGNNPDGNPMYPAAHDGVVGVGATTPEDTRASFSNFGSWVDIVAPGENIWTTELGGIQYGNVTGTSPATAIVSGVFALLLQHEPTLNEEVLMNRVFFSTRDLGDAGWDPYFGEGIVNAYAAITGEVRIPQIDTTPPRVEIVSPVSGALIWGLMPVDVEVHDDGRVAAVELFVDEQWYAVDNAAPFAFVLDTKAMQLAKHKVFARAHDLSGKQTDSRVVKFYTTNGEGLLVEKVKANDAKLLIRGKIGMMPSDAMKNSSFSTSVSGPISFAANVDAAEWQGTERVVRSDGSATMPSGWTTHIKLKKRNNLITFSIKAHGTELLRTIMGNATVRIVFGDIESSHIVPLHFSSSSVVYP